MTQEKREKLDKFFMQTAQNISEFSHCIRLKVGCIITRNDRIISSGYNGTPKDFYNCEEINANLDLENPSDRIRHHSFSEKFEIHAEINAIIDMAKRGVNPVGATIYITTAPCHNCAKLLIASKIKRVVYKSPYDLENIKNIHLCDVKNIEDEENIWYGDLSGVDILRLAKIEVEEVNLK
jgi:dCMP deaminase